MPVQSDRQTEILNNIFAGGKLSRQPQAAGSGAPVRVRLWHALLLGAVGFGADMRVGDHGFPEGCGQFQIRFTCSCKQEKDQQRQPRIAR